MQERIENSLNSDEVRPLTDLVQVKKANEITFDVTGEITIKSGVDTSSVYTNAVNNLNNIKFKIGEDVSLAKIISLLMVDNVVDVNLTTPTANITTDDYSIAILGSVNISYRITDEL
jgi:phage-related baseplate assembly protein